MIDSHLTILTCAPDGRTWRKGKREHDGGALFQATSPPQKSQARVTEAEKVSNLVCGGRLEIEVPRAAVGIRRPGDIRIEENIRLGDLTGEDVDDEVRCRENAGTLERGIGHESYRVDEVEEDEGLGVGPAGKLERDAGRLDRHPSVVRRMSSFDGDVQ